jgi:hypothetical protein
MQPYRAGQEDQLGRARALAQRRGALEYPLHRPGRQRAARPGLPGPERRRRPALPAPLRPGRHRSACLCDRAMRRRTRSTSTIFTVRASPTSMTSCGD